ncbi:hypothetical protein UFOVP257_108 [uncultured Caudovirales phage]|uniref:Uncharacterized protein n=1 Tax=uncultured Caudovirales phage TaxID=2100421 RepID=A0A6J5LGD8_9CAUD|nr:hypothetical protein UFOVP257_108 [uncultured Caudovirales phage]
MSPLEPNATYIYERADGVTYARKIGDPPDSRIAVGWDYKKDSTFLGMPVKDLAKIVDMMNAARDNPALQDALERAKVIYELSKTDSQTTQHHPV